VVSDVGVAGDKRRMEANMMEREKAEQAEIAATISKNAVQKANALFVRDGLVDEADRRYVSVVETCPRSVISKLFPLVTFFEKEVAVEVVVDVKTGTVHRWSADAGRGRVLRILGDVRPMATLFPAGIAPPMVCRLEDLVFPSGAA
jgi:hypothetical protein